MKIVECVNCGGGFDADNYVSDSKCCSSCDKVIDERAFDKFLNETDDTADQGGEIK